MKNPLHPGKIIKEIYLEPMGLTVTGTAKALGISRVTLSELINGKNGISPEMAYRLSKGFGATPESWLNLQLIYDLAQVREKGEALPIERIQPVATV
ncbi:MAG: HigA family addiction module antidote protein [Caldilineaceae bacterium]|nr:HigA family addiction module antidote protein [Caldilineaceae bacterium]